ncbi:MAG: hypothetical protein KDD44_07850 [Bdellovibrionales bacterium]|nr:hypothetical protein [Bdellovibrionales bacterium]
MSGGQTRTAIPTLGFTPGAFHWRGEDIRICGCIRSVRGALVEAELPGAVIGSRVEIGVASGGLERRSIPGTVVAVSGSVAILSILGGTAGLSSTCSVTTVPGACTAPAGSSLLGRVIDCAFEPIDGGPAIVRRTTSGRESISPGSELASGTRSAQFFTGFPALDTLIPVALGQRMAVLAEAGVGKSTFLCQLAECRQADVVVVALVGERAREVRAIAAGGFPPEVYKKTVVVASTSSESAGRRAQAVDCAHLVAEDFRSRGLNVLLLVDSLTRVVRAWREIGLGAGESPVMRGYPASTFARLPELIERAGVSGRGSITAFYSMLLGDEFEEDPMVAEICSLTDGHLFLSKGLAMREIFPAVDIVRSLSRLSDEISTPEQQTLRRRACDRLLEAREQRELLYLSEVPNPRLAQAVAFEERFVDWQRMTRRESWSREAIDAGITELRALFPAAA